MPIATVSSNSERYDLKSLPGAFVALVELSQGQIMKRQEIAIGQSMKKSGKGNTDTMDVQIHQRRVTAYEYTHSIVDHNLEYEDRNGNVVLIDFQKDPKAIDKIRGRIGAEIDGYIKELNNFDNEEADGSGN